MLQFGCPSYHLLSLRKLILIQKPSAQTPKAFCQHEITERPKKYWDINALTFVFINPFMQDDEKWSSSHTLRGLIFMNSKFRVIQIPHVEIWKYVSHGLTFVNCKTKKIANFIQTKVYLLRLVLTNIFRGISFLLALHYSKIRLNFQCQKKLRYIKNFKKY